ncbi:hypothetical protein RHMOL_Rhmol04G0288800 [Rhododendron molle]|uniref:Uncharacterized protein n=1 Tax=Rhododendron molle TaxID=49168 RepID=A0ACC0P6N6_RHOML|nr:hypothetical protein RHMOL_Rhmol04G0288800 [Rhododendron molle]
MALSRLLQVKSRPLFQRRGLVNPPKWWWRYCTYSSSSAESQKSAKFDWGEAQKSSSHSKKLNLAKEQKAAAVESFVAKYMETHQGTFPKTTHVHSNVGGSWYTVKGILTYLKEKMVGNPQLQNHSTGETSDSTVDVTATEVTTAQKSETISEFVEVKSTVMNSELNNDNTLPSSTSGMSREYSSENMINVPDFKSVQTHSISDNTETVKLETRVQSSTSLPNFGNNEKNCTNSTSHILEESSSADSVILEASNEYVNGRQNNQPETEKMTSASPTPNVSSEVGGKHSVPFGGPQKTMGIADLLTRTGETTSERNDSVTPSSPDFLNEAMGRGEEKGCDISGLIDCIKEMPEGKSNPRSHNSTTSNNNDQASNKSAIKGMQREANSPRSDNRGRNSPMHGRRTMVKETNSFKGSEGNIHEGSLFELFFDTNPTRKDSKGSGADIAALDSMKSKSSQEILFPTSKHEFKKSWNALLAEKEADANKVLVRFLHVSVKRSDVETLFNHCGCITRIDFHSKGGLFKIACIYFETKEGMQNALKKTGLILRNINLIVEAGHCKDNIPRKTLIPNLIGYPEVPASLVKNPTRTVMIRQLTADINSHDIEEALAFCGSKISGFFFGSSSSSAYVELATEEAKQRALERNSIIVSGKLLRIFRIDAPRTTVVRISNLCYPEVQNKFEGICGSYGRVKHVVVRSKDIVDVHFNITEWPNMLRILNGLNGLQVYNSQWIAQPAPVFPPEVLHVLWNHPDERRNLKTQIHRSLQKLVEYPTAHQVGLASMANEYYGTACE